MSEKPATTQTYPANDALSGWIRAYVRFLASKDESLVLKVAPLALVGVMPIDVVSNIIPGLGLLDDSGYMLIAVAVLFKTLVRVNHYRRNSSSTQAIVMR